MPAVFDLYQANGELQVDLATRLTKAVGWGTLPLGGTTITDPAFQQGDIWLFIQPVLETELSAPRPLPASTIYNRNDPGGARIVIGAYTGAATTAIWGIY